MRYTLLSAAELAPRIKFSPAYINATLKDNVLLENVHYIRPFGGRKVLYLWEVIEEELFSSKKSRGKIIPMARGGACHG